MAYRNALDVRVRVGEKVPQGIFTGTGTASMPAVVLSAERIKEKRRRRRRVRQGNQNPDNDANSFVFNMRFAGQRYDAASGLNYNLNRDYESGTGRYTQPDPIGLKGGLATFAYADGMPTQSMDPTGLAPSLSPYDPNRNTTCCVDGQLTLCMMHPGNSRYRCEFIQESMRVHERVHVEEIRRKNPSICAGTKGRYSLGFNNLREAQTSELNAFKAQLDYLSGQLRQPRCFTPECLSEANEWIDYIRNQAIPRVLNGSYNAPR